MIFRRFDFILIIIIALLLPILHTNSVFPFGEKIVDVGVGIMIIFVFPGYCLEAIFFPKLYNKLLVIRFSAAFVFSVSFGVIIVELFDLMSVGFRKLEVLWFYSMVCFVMAIIAWVLVEQAYNRAEGENVIARGRESEILRGIAIVIPILLLGAVWGIIWIWGTSTNQMGFTEFYLNRTERFASDYPTEVYSNKPIKIPIGVVNHEGETINYTIVGMVGDEPIGVLHPFEVSDGDRREGELTLIFVNVGDNQRLELLLGGDGLEYPYRSLRLWVNVVEDLQENN